MEAVHVVGSILVLVFVFGVTIQVVRHPAQATALLSTTASSWVGLEHALQGRAG